MTGARCASPLDGTSVASSSIVSTSARSMRSPLSYRLVGAVKPWRRISRGGPGAAPEPRVALQEVASVGAQACAAALVTAAGALNQRTPQAALGVVQVGQG